MNKETDYEWLEDQSGYIQPARSQVRARRNVDNIQKLYQAYGLENVDITELYEDPYRSDGYHMDEATEEEKQMVEKKIQEFVKNKDSRVLSGPPDTTPRKKIPIPIPKQAVIKRNRLIAQDKKRIQKNKQLLSDQEIETEEKYADEVELKRKHQRENDGIKIITTNDDECDLDYKTIRCRYTNLENWPGFNQQTANFIVMSNTDVYNFELFWKVIVYRNISPVAGVEPFIDNLDNILKMVGQSSAIVRFIHYNTFYTCGKDCVLKHTHDLRAEVVIKCKFNTMDELFQKEKIEEWQKDLEKAQSENGMNSEYLKSYVQDCLECDLCFSCSEEHNTRVKAKEKKDLTQNQDHVKGVPLRLIKMKYKFM